MSQVNLFQQFMNLYLQAQRNLSAIQWHLLEIARQVILLIPTCVKFVTTNKQFSDQMDVPNAWDQRQRIIEFHLVSAFSNKRAEASRWHNDMNALVLNELKQMRDKIHGVFSHNEA